MSRLINALQSDVRLLNFMSLLMGSEEIWSTKINELKTYFSCRKCTENYVTWGEFISCFLPECLTELEYFRNHPVHQVCEISQVVSTVGCTATEEIYSQVDAGQNISSRERNHYIEVGRLELLMPPSAKRKSNSLQNGSLTAKELEEIVTRLSIERSWLMNTIQRLRIDAPRMDIINLIQNLYSQSLTKLVKEYTEKIESLTNDIKAQREKCAQFSSMVDEANTKIDALSRAKSEEFINMKNNLAKMNSLMANFKHREEELEKQLLEIRSKYSNVSQYH